MSYKMPADGDQHWIPLPLIHGPNMLWEWKPETLAQRTAFTAFPVAGTARSASPCVMWWFTSPQFALWELLWKLLLYSKSWQHLAFIWGWMHGLYIKAISFFPLEIPCGINLFVSTNQMAVWDPLDDIEYTVLSFSRLSEEQKPNRKIKRWLASPRIPSCNHRVPQMLGENLLWNFKIRALIICHKLISYLKICTFSVCVCVCVCVCVYLRTEV